MEEIVNKKNSFKRLLGFLRDHLAELISFIIAFAGLCAYFLWLFAENGRMVPGIAASLVCFALFTLGLMLGVPRAIRFFRGDKETAPVELLGARSTTRKRLHPILRIFIMGLVYHFIIILAAYFIHTIVFGYNGSVFSTLRTIWIKTDNDSIHYISIAENWYTTEFPQAWAIVFLPLYPLCIRAANLIFGDSFVSGFVLNILFSAGAGVLIYELALCDLGRRSSRFAVFCAFALPAAIFYVAPMSEPLFLLLTCASLLAMRKQRFLLAAVFGALSAFTRSLGVLLIVPFACEAAVHCVDLYRGSIEEKGERAARTALTKRIVTLALCGLLLCAGFGAYLLINKLIWGEWFKFMQFQKENWYQSLGWFFNTAYYQTTQMIKRFAEGDLETSLALWLPNLLYIFGSLAVFVAVARDIRTSYLLYFAAYFAVSCGATWLLSAPRYMTALAVLPIAIAKLCESGDDGRGLIRARAKSALVSTLLLAGQAIFLVLFVLRYKVY